METTELRIGNIIGATLAGNTIPDRFENERQKHLWDNYGQVIKTIESGHDIDNAWWFFPIKLTEEWLVNFGFKYHETYHVKWHHEVLDLCMDLNGYFNVGNDHPESPAFFGEHLQYVHQLQNLYFALTGKEL